MTVDITIIKNSASGNGTQHSFPYGFKIFADGDLDVIIRSSTGTETVKQLNTDYIVTNAGSDSGGNVLFKFNTGNSGDAHFSSSDKRPQSGETVILRRGLDITQSTDYVANDPFPAESHENALDRLTLISQELQEELDRSIKLSRTNTMTSTEFTVGASDRASKVLAFDSSGEISVTQELGTFKGNWAASTAYVIRDIVKDTSTNNIFIVTEAHTSSGSQPLTTNANSAKYSLIVDAASATTSATNAASSATAAANSATAAGNSETAAAASETAAASSETAAASSQSAAASSATAAANAQAAAEAALDTFDDRFLGAKSSDPSVDNDGNALLDGALYFDTTNDIMKVYDLTNTQWRQLTLTSTNQTNVNTVASQISPTNNIATVAGDTTNIGTVASDLAGTDSIGTVATNISSINSVAASVGGSVTYAVTVANVGGANIFLLDGVNYPTLILTRGFTYIFDQSDSSNAGHPLAFKNGSSSYTSGVTVTGTAGQAGAKVTFVVPTNAPETGLRYYCTVHGNAMGNTITTQQNDIATVVANIGAVNGFAARYRISSSAPTTSLDIGDLYFDTTANELKVYKSSGWAAAGSTVNGTSARFTYNITGTPTTLTGASGTGFAEANGQTLAYDAGFIDVYLNGVKMVNGTDVTVTSGTSVVFASALSNGDVVDIVAFGTFNVAAINAANINDGTIPDARFPATLPAISGANLTNLDASDLASGTVPIARIGTGTKNTTTFLRGDNTFTTIDLSTLSPLAGSSSLVTTGALDSGSITSGFGNIDNGSSTITTSGALNAKGGVVFNEDAADVDFRVESSNDPNLLVVDGGSDFVSIGESSQVNGGKLSIATSAASAILSLLSRSTTDSDEAFIVLQKSSTDSGNFAATVDGEALGSIKFRGVNTSNVSDIGAEINVVQNGTSSTSVPTDIKIRTNEAERMVIKSTTGLIKYNGAFVYYFRGSVNNNASVSIDVPDITSAGATMVTAFYTHHAIQNYGASRISVLGMYIGGIVSTHNIQNITSSGGGSWSFSSPGNNVLRITKNAGTYIGGGHYVVKVETFNGPS